MKPGETAAEASVPAPKPKFARYAFVLGIAIYFALVWWLGWREVGERLLGADLLLVLGAFLIIFASGWARAGKWRYALGPGHNATGIYFLSKVSAEWSPGRLGEFSPMVLKKHRTPKIGAWIMFDRLLEIAVTLALGLYGLAAIRVFSTPAYLAISTGVIAAFVFGVYLLTRRELFLRLAVRLKDGSWPHRFTMLFAAISDELFSFSKRLPVMLIITVLTKCADLLAVSLVFRAFSYTVSFSLVAAAKCALAIVSFLPVTPVATGLPHVTQAGIMNYIQDIPFDALAAAIGVEVAIVSLALWTSGGIAALLTRNSATAAESV